MPAIQLYLNDQLADTNGGVKIALRKVVADYRNPTKKTGAFTYTIKLPKSVVNRRIFAHEDDAAVLGKFRNTYTARLEVAGVTLIEGTFKHASNEPDAFVGNITGDHRNKKLGDLLGDKKLREITSFEKLDFDGDASILASLTNTSLYWAPGGRPNGDANWTETCFPYVYDSFARLQNLHGVALNYERFGVSHFAGAVVDRIAEDEGYAIQGSITATPEWRKLCLLYSNEDGQEPPYNYGRLAPGSMNGAFVNTAEDEDGDGYWLVVCNPGEYGNLTTIQGDRAQQLDSDGVFSPKFSGDYDIRFTWEVQVINNGQTGFPPFPHKAVAVFRDLSDGDTIDQPWGAIPYADFDPDHILDSSCLLSSVSTSSPNSGSAGNSGDDSNSNLTPNVIRLEAGHQYRLQIYVAVPKGSRSSFAGLRAYSLVNNSLQVTACTAPLQLNPALFLPDMKQSEYLAGIFRLFNLFYDLDEAAKVLTLYTADEYYAANAVNIIDLTNRCDPRTFSESPFTDAELGQMFCKFATDGDFLSVRTDLMEAANKNAEATATELPFAPLGFVEVPIRRYEMDDSYEVNEVANGIDLVPCILPDADVANSALLGDYTAESNFAYKPRLALYEQSALRDPLWQSSFGGVNQLPPDPLNHEGLYLKRAVRFNSFIQALPIPRPRLTFFGPGYPVRYKVQEDTARRLISLVRSTDPNIYTLSDPDLLALPVVSTDVSLAIDVDQPSAFYTEAYRNNRLLARHSHTVDGACKMDAALYTRLDGKGLIRIGSGYYLLSGISGYEVGGETAKIELYVQVI